MYCEWISVLITKYQQNALSNDIPQEEIEIIDPVHPLIGRTFSVVSVSRHSKCEYVLVRYQEQILLRIPIIATNLSLPDPYVIRTKLNLSSVEEFLEIAKECKALCRSSQNISGQESQRPYKSKSCKTSLSSSRR